MVRDPTWVAEAEKLRNKAVVKLIKRGEFPPKPNDRIASLIEEYHASN